MIGWYTIKGCGWAKDGRRRGFNVWGKLTWTMVWTCTGLLKSLILIGSLRQVLSCMSASRCQQWWWWLRWWYFLPNVIIYGHYISRRLLYSLYDWENSAANLLGTWMEVLRTGTDSGVGIVSPVRIGGELMTVTEGTTDGAWERAEAGRRPFPTAALAML